MPDLNAIERCIFPSSGLHVERADSRNPIITGYAAVFNTLSLPMWGFREQIAKGAFSDVLHDDVRSLFNHDPNLLLGRTTSGTLTLAQDERGLHIDTTPPDTQTGRDTVELIRRGDVSQMSFAFTIGEESWQYSDDPAQPDIRTIVKVKQLYDVSPVTYPAYPDTTVGLRTELQRIAGRVAGGLAITDSDKRLYQGDPSGLGARIALQQEQLRLLLEIARA